MTEELESILNRVLAMYRKYGIRSVTMDDTAHELGISKKTLYQYVRDKDDLVNQVIDLEIAHRNEVMNNLSRTHKNAIEEMLEISHCIGDMIREYNPATEYDLKKYYPEQYSKLKALHRDHIFKTIYENLKRGKEEGLYRNDINEETICKINVAYIDCLLENELFTADDLHNPSFYKEFFTYHIHGIINNKGLKVLEAYQSQVGQNEKNK